MNTAHGKVRDTKVALVAGAGGGIGSVVARQLAAQGHRLLLLDRDQQRLDAIANALSAHLAAAPLCLDTADTAELHHTWSVLPDDAAPDILVNAVGGDTRIVDVVSLDEADLDRSIRDNLLGVHTLTRLCVPKMRERQWGRIVNLASIAGRTYTHFSNAGYVAAKAAVIGYTKQCAYELAPHGIAVNAVAHGPIMTDRISESWSIRPESERALVLSRIPAGRLGSAAEAAAIVTHLCSQDAGYIVGAVIDVNGGLHI